MADNKKKNTGKLYEKAAAAYFRRTFPGCKVQHDVKVQGLHGEEQIDILITFKQGGLDFRIAIEAKDYSGPLQKGIFADIERRFRSIRANKGIILCSKGIQSGFKRLVARSEIDLDVRVLTFEELVAGEWAEDFLQAIEQIKLAKEAIEITPFLAQQVCDAIEERPHYARYFFHELNNPVWLKVLAEKGVFERCMNEENSINKNILCDYVCRTASTNEEAFLRFARALKPPYGWMVDDLARSALNLSEATCSEFAAIATDWEQAHIHDTDAFGKLIISEIRNGRTPEAFSLLSNLTKIAAIEEVWSTGATYRLASALDEHWFQDLTTALFPKLATEAPRATLAYSRQRLHEASLAKYPQLDGDLPTWVRRHVGEEERGYFDILDALSAAYRDSLLAVLPDNVGELLSECREVMEIGEQIGPLRCVLYAVGIRFEELGNLLEIAIANKDWWNERSVEPELETLVERNWDQIPVSQQEEICDILLTLPPNPYREDEEEDAVELRRKVNVVQWLAILRELKLPDSRAEEVERVYSEFATETGVSMREPREGPQVFVANSVPEDTSSFGEKSAAEVLQACIDFKDHWVGFDHKTPSGVASKLKDEVAKRPLDFCAHPDLIEALPYQTYRSDFIDGLAKACKANLIEESKAVELVMLLLKESMGLDAEQRDSYEVGNKRWTRMQAARFIRDVAEQSPQELSQEDLESLFDLWRFLRVLVNDDEVSDSTTGLTDFYERSLNRTDGELSIGLSAVSSRVLHRQRIQDLPSEEQDALKVLWQQVRQEIKDYVLASHDPVVRCPIARNMPEFICWDRALLADHLDEWFPRGEPQLGLAFLEGSYHRSQRFSDTLHLLHPKLLECTEHLSSEQLRGQWCEGFSEEMAVFWWSGDLADDDELLNRFFANAQEKDIETAIHWTGVRVKSKECEHWRKAILLWRLIASRRPDLAPNALRRVYFNLPDLPDEVKLSDFEDILLLGTDTDELYIQENGLDVLVARSLGEPETVSRILKKISEAKLRWVPSFLVTRLIKAAANCFRIGNESVKANIRDMKRAMLTRGVMGFEALELD